jgi:hypothetical protein
VRILATLTAAEIAPRKMLMLWRDRIPASTLTVIAGVPGLGKSTLATMVAAELSREGIDVVLSNLEDDPASVTRPRLDVADADLDRVHIVPPSTAPAFPADLELLDGLIKHTNAKAVILDPIGAHFTPERQVHHRPTLRLLMDIARARRCAVIGVHHTIKSGGTAIELIGGPSGGLAGSARAVYLYGYDPHDEDRRALACVKVNGVDRPPALILGHETVEYDVAGQCVDAGLLLVLGESDLLSKKVLREGRRNEQRDNACLKWLSLYLADGEDCTRRSRDVQVEGGRAGYRWPTLQRAATRLHVEKNRQGGLGADGWWTWRLPDEHPLRDPMTEAA